MGLIGALLMSYTIQIRTRSRHSYKWQTVPGFRYVTREHAVNAARLMFPHGYSPDCVRFRHHLKG